jgi:hypothetical protein
MIVSGEKLEGGEICITQCAGGDHEALTHLQIFEIDGICQAVICWIELRIDVPSLIHNCLISYCTAWSQKSAQVHGD